uniref:RanBD1 domain-containing protein n=1 Tax=Gorilla gorilla gorilla TaxID=9595 RepID=G3R478_GORGO
MKGFYFAKLYYEAKEYDLAKKYIRTYINVRERDPKAHRFLGLLYELEENTEKAVECYRRSVELNPTQKDLVLKIAELLCKNDVTDGRAKYWVERAAKVFPGSPAIYKLKEQLLDCEGEDGRNKLFDLIQSELYVRPDDVHVNIRLVELYRSNKRLKDAVARCREAERNIALRSSLEWNSCVVQTLKVDKSYWVFTFLCRQLAYIFLVSLCHQAGVQWRNLSSLQPVPRPKIKLIKGEAGQNLLEMMACDRLSQSGNKMLKSVMEELEAYSEGGPLYKNGSLRNADSEIKHSTPSPTKYSLSPSKSYKYSPKTPPQWAEDQNSLMKMICQEVKAITKEMQELKLNSSKSASRHRWPTENYGPDSVPDGYQGSQTFHGAPLTVATTGPSVYYSQSPAYNSQYLLRPAANVTPTKGSSNTEFKSTKEGFSIPVSADGFKFGISEPGNQEKKSEKPLENDTGFQAQDISGQKNGCGVIFGQTSSTFTFADLAKSTSGEGFQFGKKDPNFKGFSGAGEKLVSSQYGKMANKKDDDAYKTEDNDDIHFEPVVQMPEKVELVTGEEDEKVLYSQRVKLFRFDAEVSQWKERGLGNLKILKNEVNGKLRMLMRREQVLKVCANHWITTTMNLKPLSGSDRAWMWLASDFSDGDAKLEQLAAKFKTPELAEEFKQKFEECQRLLLDIPLQTPHKLVDTGRAAKLIQRAEEMKSGLKDFKTFLTNDQTKVTEEENKGSGTGAASASDTTIKPNPENTGPTLEWDNYDLREDALDDSVSSSSVHASPLASSPVRKNLFRFGESTTGFNFSFKSALSPSKSPAKLNQSGTSVGTDEESDVTQEEERDGQYFEPVVPLPDLVEVSSGEENEQVVFSHRAKLYRYDKDVGQWKERGIGDIKILQNYDNKQVRIVMRRDQVLKLCANHRITPDMTLQNMKGTERVWLWTACDFADGERKVEYLAVRFKLQDVADSFKKIFDEAKTAQEKDCLITPHVSRSSTPRESPCGKIAVAVLEETTRERTDVIQGDDVADATSEVEVSSTSETTTKAVVSPPKFVFGSESVKSIFSSEKSKPFAFGNSSATGSLFGFSFNAPLKSNNSETSSVAQSGSESKVEPNKCELSKNSDIEQSSDSKVKNLFASFPTEESSINYTFKTPEK